MKKLVLLSAALLVAGCGEKSSSEGSDSAGASAGPSGDVEVSKKVSELSELRAKAVRGDAYAQFNLGARYHNDEDDKEAAKWFRKAAERGHAMAQYILGYMYDEGEGVLEDDKEAVKWYRKAAEQGEFRAQFRLGSRGVLEDSVTAYAWFNIAAANGSENAKDGKRALAEEMTPERIAKAQELSREMVKKNPKLLK